MAKRKQIEEMISGEQEAKETMEMLLTLMQTGECIGRLDFRGTRYQLWDYKTTQQSKLPGDVIVEICVNRERFTFIIKKIYARKIELVAK